MKLLLPLSLPLLFSLSASAAIVERRIWIDTAINHLKEDLCKDSLKTWRCLFPDRERCEKVMEDTFGACNPDVVPELPEYIDSPETAAQADKVVKDCLAKQLTGKYILTLPREKMVDYNVCIGVMARQKPLNPNLQKALDNSKALGTPHCASGTYYRKCFSITEKECGDTLARHHLDCAMKMEADGLSVKADEASIREVSGKISECALSAMRKGLDAKKIPLSHDPDCQ